MTRAPTLEGLLFALVLFFAAAAASTMAATSAPPPPSPAAASAAAPPSSSSAVVEPTKPASASAAAHAPDKGADGAAATNRATPASFIYRPANSLFTPGSELLDGLGPLKQLTEGEHELERTRDHSCFDPLSWSVTIRKSRHELTVYYKGHLFKTYHAVFGRNPDPGAKLWEGDLRTPEGVYFIIGEYNHPRWKHFLRLNYPNFVDRRRYGEMMREGVVPALHGRYRALGSAIGIHGSDRPRFNRDDINWTSGCVSVDNDAIVELYHLLPVDTLVIIKP